MKGRVRVCAEGGKIKKRTRTKSETENFGGVGGGREEMFGAGPPLPPHPPKFRVAGRFFSK